MSDNNDNFIPDVPAIEEFHLNAMEQSGLSIDEYCNQNGFNISDILVEEE